MLRGERTAESVVKKMKVSKHDRAVATSIIGFHTRRYSGEGSHAGQEKKVRSFLKPLRERRAVRFHVSPQGPPALENLKYSLLALTHT